MSRSLVFEGLPFSSSDQLCSGGVQGPVGVQAAGWVDGRSVHTHISRPDPRRAKITGHDGIMSRALMTTKVVRFVEETGDGLSCSITWMPVRFG